MSLTPKENLLRALSHRTPDHVPYPAEHSWCLVDHRGRRPPRSGVDEWGVVWAPLPDDYRASLNEPAYSFPVQPAAPTVGDLAHHRFPDGCDAGLFVDLLRGIDCERTLVIGQHPAGPLDRFGALLGPQNAMLALLEEHSASRDVLERIVDYHVGIAQGYVAAGVGAGWLADDYAGQQGSLLRPSLWRQLVLPGLTRVMRVYHEAGRPVFFHTCGRAEAFIGDLIAAGATALNLESALCDLPRLKREFGPRIAFMGGVPVDVMLSGVPDEVEAVAARAIAELGSEGGLVLAPDQPLAYPAASEAALTRAAQLRGRYAVVPEL